MSVLIIALPRTGSTSLLQRIASEKNLRPLFEPFDGTGRVQYNNENNVVVKTIICHHPNNLELSKNFDEVILLSRRNLIECAESHAYQTHFSKTKNYNSNNPYLYENAPPEVFDLCYSDILKWSNDIEKLSTILNIPIVYYEDLFDPKSKDRLRKGNRSKSHKDII